jgi:transcription elongation factor GreA
VSLWYNFRESPAARQSFPPVQGALRPVVAGLFLFLRSIADMADDIVLTPAGKKKVEEELDHLKTVEMPALAERIRQARSLGDLSENFDYQDAKRQQGFVAGKIADLQAILDRASLMEETGPGAEVVGMGSKVSLRDIDYDEELTYTLVGAYEADPQNDKISVSSPVGKALMGNKVGDKVEVTTPGGISTFEILAIE